MPTATNDQQGVFEQMAQNTHEQVVFCQDEHTGLKAIIAIHNTVLGPALGGTRMWNYATEAEAVYDVLRLSRGMTYKAAISGINLGGGKAVIIGDSYKDKSEALWRRYGKFVDSLDGKYITAEDVGTSPADIEFVRMETGHCAGVPEFMGGGGDPSPVTAYGTYLGMKAAAKKQFGNDSLRGKKVLVQGVGHVGQYLVEHLAEEAAEILIADINADHIKNITSEYKVTVIAPDDVYAADMDIYAPCALGATLNGETIPKLKCSIVAGAANNQLQKEDEHGDALKEKGVIYAPDFLINAGGLINCYAELDGYDRNRAMAYTEKIYNRTLQIFDLAEKEKINNQVAAMRMAQERIDNQAKINAVL